MVQEPDIELLQDCQRALGRWCADGSIQIEDEDLRPEVGPGATFCAGGCQGEL